MIPATHASPTALGGDGRCLVMGVLNVTPDSFSDGGRIAAAETAIELGVALAQQGADIVDVGGESTRPGATRVSEEEELRRVLPVVQGLAREGVTVSVDTMRARTASLCVDAGAVLINDVSGGLADPDMFARVADLCVPIIVGHWRAPSAVMDQFASYDDVVEDVVRELSWRCDAATTAGVLERNIVVDPCLGFSKTTEHNWMLVASIPRLLELGRPLLIGASRKRFLVECTRDPNRAVRDVRSRDDASAALATIAAWQGVWGVRVHDPAPVASATKCVRRIRAVDRRRNDLVPT